MGIEERWSPIEAVGGPLDGYLIEKCKCKSDSAPPEQEFTYTAKQHDYVYELVIKQVGEQMQYRYVLKDIARAAVELIDDMKESIKRIQELTEDPPQK